MILFPMAVVVIVLASTIEEGFTFRDAALILLAIGHSIDMMILHRTFKREPRP